MEVTRCRSDGATTRTRNGPQTARAPHEHEDLVLRLRSHHAYNRNAEHTGVYGAPLAMHDVTRTNKQRGAHPHVSLVRFLKFPKHSARC